MIILFRKFRGDLLGLVNNATGDLDRFFPCLGIGRGFLCNVAGDFVQR